MIIANKVKDVWSIVVKNLFKTCTLSQGIYEF